MFYFKCQTNIFQTQPPEYLLVKYFHKIQFLVKFDSIFGPNHHGYQICLGAVKKFPSTCVTKPIEKGWRCMLCVHCVDKQAPFTVHGAISLLYGAMHHQHYTRIYGCTLHVVRMLSTIIVIDRHLKGLNLLISNHQCDPYLIVYSLHMFKTSLVHEIMKKITILSCNCQKTRCPASFVHRLVPCRHFHTAKCHSYAFSSR